MYETEPSTVNIDIPILDEEITHGTEEVIADISPAVSEPTTDGIEPAIAEATQNDAPRDTAPSLPEPEPSPETVPLARLQGVQRALSQVERDRDSYKGMLQVVQQELAAAQSRAASEYAERLKSTQRDIVPDLIIGSTIEQVDAALANSRAAFAAARQAYARTIPTPQPGAGNPPATQPPAQQKTSAVDLISQGLRQPTLDINK
jgi:hypothetical protein